MGKIAEFCKDMNDYEHVMTFREMGNALVKGAVIGQKSGVAGGVVIGATTALCVLAGSKVVAISEDLLTRYVKSNKIG